MSDAKDAAKGWCDPHFISETEGYGCDPEDAFLAGALWMNAQALESWPFIDEQGDGWACFKKNLDRAFAEKADKP